MVSGTLSAPPPRGRPDAVGNALFAPVPIQPHRHGIVARRPAVRARAFRSFACPARAPTEGASRDSQIRKDPVWLTSPSS